MNSEGSGDTHRIDASQEIIANIKNLSPTLLAGAVGGGTLALALTAGGGLTAELSFLRPSQVFPRE